MIITIILIAIAARLGWLVLWMAWAMFKNFVLHSPLHYSALCIGLIPEIIPYLVFDNIKWKIKYFKDKYRL